MKNINFLQPKQKTPRSGRLKGCRGMVELLCLMKKRNEAYRRLVNVDCIEFISDTPFERETVVILKGKGKPKNRAVVVLEKYDDVKARIKKTLAHSRARELDIKEGERYGKIYNETSHQSGLYP